MRGNYFVPTVILNQPARIQHAAYKRVNGVQTVEYREDERVIYVSAKSYGGTEKTVNDVYSIEDTMEFTSYYDPDIKAQDRIVLLGSGTVWEILNTPENVDMRGAFLKFKGRRYHG